MLMNTKHESSHRISNENSWAVPFTNAKYVHLLPSTVCTIELD